ncbi:MFS transporter tetracycline:hydrogen antiporter [Gracilaria domingensis]|nr:MFS transporter tetracycline:hydrogen antiporter [Gracilaria domingensis]
MDKRDGQQIADDEQIGGRGQQASKAGQHGKADELQGGEVGKVVRADGGRYGSRDVRATDGHGGGAEADDDSREKEHGKRSRQRVQKMARDLNEGRDAEHGGGGIGVGKIA